MGNGGCDRAEIANATGDALRVVASARIVRRVEPCAPCRATGSTSPAISSAPPTAQSSVRIGIERSTVVALYAGANKCPRPRDLSRPGLLDASLSAQIFAGPEPDRDAFQQAQGLSAQGRRTNNSAPAPPDRQIRAYPHYPRSFQLFQACRLCVKSTGICSSPPFVKK